MFFRSKCNNTWHLWSSPSRMYLVFSHNFWTSQSLWSKHKIAFKPVAIRVFTFTHFDRLLYVSPIYEIVYLRTAVSHDWPSTTYNYNTFGAAISENALSDKYYRSVAVSLIGFAFCLRRAILGIGIAYVIRRGRVVLWFSRVWMVYMKIR